MLYSATTCNHSITSSLRYSQGLLGTVAIKCMLRSKPRRTRGWNSQGTRTLSRILDGSGSYRLSSPLPSPLQYRRASKRGREALWGAKERAVPLTSAAESMFRRRIPRTLVRSQEPPSSCESRSISIRSTRAETRPTVAGMRTRLTVTALQITSVPRRTWRRAHQRSRIK